MAVGGMGRPYNEVMKGLLCTMDAKGVQSHLNCVRREEEAAELVRLCALVRGRYSRGGCRVCQEQKNNHFQLAAYTCSIEVEPPPAQPTSDTMPSIEVLTIVQMLLQQEATCFMGSFS